MIAVGMATRTRLFQHGHPNGLHSSRILVKDKSALMYIMGIRIFGFNLVFSAYAIMIYSNGPFICHTWPLTQPPAHHKHGINPYQLIWTSTWNCLSKACPQAWLGWCTYNKNGVIDETTRMNSSHIAKLNTIKRLHYKEGRKYETVWLIFLRT